MDNKPDEFYLSLMTSPGDSLEETRKKVSLCITQILAEPDSPDAALLRSVQADKTAAPTVRDFFLYLLAHLKTLFDLVMAEEVAKAMDVPPSGEKKEGQ